MRITCGACWGLLKIADRLAGQTGRCPKCGARIRVPPAGSPVGTHAEVLVADGADEPREPAVATPAESTPHPGPKTEPLPATLKRPATSTAGQSAVHEEPARHKTRPLPKPVGRPSPLVDLPPWPAGAGQRQERTIESLADAEQDTDAHDAGGDSRKTLFTPLVPVAFVLGLIVGGVFGWFVGKPAGSDHATAVAPPQTPAAVENITLPKRPTPTVTTPPATPPLPFRRVEWAATQPADTAVEIAEATVSSIRVAGMMDSTPAASKLHWPAPPGQIYVEMKATLKWTGLKAGPVTIRLGGRDADVWLVTRDGRVFNGLGRPRDTGPSETVDSPADTAAKVTLDAENPQVDLSLLFLTPVRLPASRLQITGLAFADLADDIREPTPVISGRSVAGRWEPIPEQEPLAQFGNQPVMAALSAGGERHGLLIERDGDHFRVQVEGTAIDGELSQRGDDPALFDATFRSAGGEQIGATLRVFDGSRKVLIYFGAGEQMQVAYRRGK